MFTGWVKEAGHIDDLLDRLDECLSFVHSKQATFEEKLIVRYLEQLRRRCEYVLLAINAILASSSSVPSNSTLTELEHLNAALANIIGDLLKAA
ncbi:MAG: hypothetical protein HY711_11525, partial [Candidatus Melainabacteria bacterium]|nr:hypothetical protein [Candidatus Melainabacteria bacterium]